MWCKRYDISPDDAQRDEEEFSKEDVLLDILTENNNKVQPSEEEQIQAFDFVPGWTYYWFICREEPTDLRV